ncbi:MAG TPA: 3-phenylpropionate/cinnamic acid dioxygenase subunit beta [Candidatus Binatia bacterium]|nr:3-phenylpropionate/cinnamic acid dioxygenase subunit beta [Candidatus Binatia bacterium]
MHRFELEREVAEFLYREAELLDSNRLEQWLELLTEDINYEMPLRMTRERGQPDVSSQTGHFSEDRRSLELRVKRLGTDFGWAENPPSRTRRFISNIRVENTADANEVKADSYFLLYRNRGSSTQADLISGERQDLLRRRDGGWKLASRLILVDQAVLGTRNLAIFF